MILKQTNSSLLFHHIISKLGLCIRDTFMMKINQRIFCKPLAVAWRDGQSWPFFRNTKTLITFLYNVGIAVLNHKFVVKLFSSSVLWVFQRLSDGLRSKSCLTVLAVALDLAVVPLKRKMKFVGPKYGLCVTECGFVEHMGVQRVEILWSPGSKNHEWTDSDKPLWFNASSFFSILKLLRWCILIYSTTSGPGWHHHW